MKTFRVNHGNPGSTCHVMPFKVNYDGPLNTDKFEPNGGQSNFRGRPLVGQAVDLQGYTGVVFELTDESGNDEATDVRVASKFDGLTVWEHGRAPDSDDMWAGRVEELVSVTRVLAAP